MWMSRRLRERWRLVLCLLPLLFFLGHATGWWRVSLLEAFDSNLYDARLLSTLKPSMDDRIVIVDVNEASLSEVGHWPWSRDLIAALLDELIERQRVQVIGIDMVFAEYDRSSGLDHLRRFTQEELPANSPVVEWVKSKAHELDFDARFVEAVRHRPVVLGYYLSADGLPTRIGELPQPVFSGALFDAAHVAHVPYARRQGTWSGYGSNVPELTQAAGMAGFFNALTDGDGIVRSVPLLAEFEGHVYESLALSTYRYSLGKTQLALSRMPSGALDAVLVQDAHGRLLSRLNINANAAAFVPFRGRGGTSQGDYRYVSAADVLKQRMAPSTLAGKIVLIGSSAPGLQDVRATPVSGTYPGVEVHASLITGMLDGSLRHWPDYSVGYEVMILLLLGALLIVLPHWLGGASTIWLFVVTPLALISMDLWLFMKHQLVLPLAGPLLLCAVLAVLTLLFGYVVESRERRQLMRVFGTYVPPELVHEMVKRPDEYNMRANSRELTIMFCDLQGFTELSERMDPQEVQGLLNSLFSHLTDAIYQHGGTVDKYMGDCVMAFWGAPVSNPNHAGQAVAAALAIQERVKTLNAARRIEGRPPIRVCIGLNTGVVAVGDMGSDKRRSYTVIGDAVNLASRLESLTRVYGFDVVVGERTSLLSIKMLWQHVDCVQVKGRAQTEQIYTPVCELVHASEEMIVEVDAWNIALDEYLDGRHEPMREFLAEHADQLANKPLYRLYAQRLSELDCQAQPLGGSSLTTEQIT